MLGNNFAETRLQLSCWNKRQADILRERLQILKINISSEEDWRGSGVVRELTPMPEIHFYIDNIPADKMVKVLHAGHQVTKSLERSMKDTRWTALVIYHHLASPINGPTVSEGWLDNIE